MADGLVESRGRGSFVTGEALVEPPNTLMGLSELGRSRGLEAGADVLEANVRPATIDEAETFSIAPGAELFELRRVRMLDGLPISLDHNRVPLRLRAGARGHSTSPPPRCTTCSTAPGIRPAARTTSSRPAPPRCEEAELLGLAPEAPVLFATTVAIGADGRIVDLGRTVYRADRYRFQATLMRRAHVEGEASHEETFAMRGAAARCSRSPSPRAAGPRGRTSPTSSRRGRRLRPSRRTGSRSSAPSRSTSSPAEGSGGPRDALKELTAAVRGEVPERHGRPVVPRLRELDQAGQARRRERQPAGRVRRQPGLPGRRRAREGGADPAARRVRQGLRLGQVLHAGDAAAVRVDRRRRRRSARARSGASPRPASRPACSRTRRSSRRRASTRRR